MPPLIVYDSGDILVFEDASAAASYLEPWIIESICAFDHIGNPLQGYHVRSKGLDEVHFRPYENQVSGAEELKQLLSEFLASIEDLDLKWYQSLTLDELVTRSLRYKTV